MADYIDENYVHTEDEIAAFLARKAARPAVADDHTFTVHLVGCVCDLCEARAEIERLRAAGDALARYMAMEHYPEDCEDECESLAAWRAWQEARRG